ncbi:MAG: dihydroorotase [Gammaproteobacteria bacterium]|nr:dihydroorotase [Gammaproteobacteria bacterium]
MHIEIRRPDDWHVHFRDGSALTHTANATATTFARALVMPNLVPALTQVSAIIDYRQRILQALPQKSPFNPFMTLYLSDQTTPDTLIEMKTHPFILGAKLYPAHATTNASQGVQSIEALYPLFDLMQSLELVLQIHGELPSSDIFDREADFITQILMPITQQFPRLRIVLEHISTRAAVDFVHQASAFVAATLTPHHLIYDRNDLLAGGVKPHLYCLPILKRAEDKKALLTAALSGNPKFFAGTDSAPHAIQTKESHCGCAGIYSASYAVALYAEVFDSHHKLPLLSAFLSEHGANFYHQPLNTGSLILKREPQLIPLSLPFGDHQVIPMKAGESLSWSTYDPS